MVDHMNPNPPVVNLTPPPPSEPPIYDSVAYDLGWSPDMLDPPFDIEQFIATSRSKATAARVLAAAADQAVARLGPQA
jgi:hypothetical protein